MKIRFTWTSSLAVGSAVSLALPLANSARAQQSTFDWKQASGARVIFSSQAPFEDGDEGRGRQRWLFASSLNRFNL